MFIVRGILYIIAAVTVAGSVEGLLGNHIGLHNLMANLPVYPDSPVLALVLGIGIFAATEYLSFSTGEPPVILYIAAFLARTLLGIATLMFFVAIVGIIISLLVALGPLKIIQERFPVILFNFPSAWLTVLLWVGVLVASSFIVYRLNPRFALTRKHHYPEWLRAEDFEEVWEQEHRPDEGDGKIGPAMKQLATRGIRPIYIERPTLEGLGRLAGEVGLLNIFVDCPSATWPDDEIMRAMQSVRGSLRWIEKEARGRVGLRFKDIGHVRAPTPGWPATDRTRLTTRELRFQVLEILGGIGIEALEDLHYYLLRYSDEPGNIALLHFYLRAGTWCLPHLHPNVGIAYCFHRHDPEIARPHFLADEDLVTFPDLSCVYAHMILHMFGASDKPMRNVHPNIDIMSAVALEFNDLLIGFKTAQEIGW